MYGVAAYAECAYAEAPAELPPLLKPATTYGGLAAQHVMLLYFLERRDPELAEVFRATIQCDIERLRNLGRDKSEDRLEFEAWYPAQVAAGYDRKTIVRTAAQRWMKDPSQIRGWIKELGAN